VLKHISAYKRGMHFVVITRTWTSHPNIIEKWFGVHRNMTMEDFANDPLEYGNLVRPTLRETGFSKKAKGDKERCNITRSEIEKNLIVSGVVIEGRKNGIFRKGFRKFVNFRRHTCITNGDFIERLNVINESPGTRSFLFDEEVTAAIGPLGMFQQPFVQLVLHNLGRFFLHRFRESEVLLLPGDMGNNMGFDRWLNPNIQQSHLRIIKSNRSLKLKQNIHKQLHLLLGKGSTANLNLRKSFRGESAAARNGFAGVIVKGRDEGTVGRDTVRERGVDRVNFAILALVHRKNVGRIMKNFAETGFVRRRWNRNRNWS
jgi:hypothetical protein